MVRGRKLFPVRKRMAEALDRHTAAMLADPEGYREGASDSDQAELGSLMAVAAHLARTLIPVEPTPEYVDSLKARLVDMHARQVAAAQEVAAQRGFAQNPRMLRTILSIFAVTALAARLIASIVMVIAILASRRRRSAAVW